ncbi:MAG: nuclear transport factor 2 family protein [Candidatus Binatia bacterium]
MTLPTPEDHVAITHLLAQYCLSLDHDDVEGCVALFTPDAGYDVFGRSFEGHDGIRRMMKAAPGGLHLGGPPVVEMLGDDRARTKQNLLFVDRTSGVSRSVVYTDELRRTETGWRFARRRCQFIVREGLSDRPAA